VRGLTDKASLPAGRQVRGVVRTITGQTANVVTLRLDAPVKFKPGQSVALTFPADPKKRFYTISSSPTEGRFLDLTIQVTAGGPVETALKALKRGDELELEGPHGAVFNLPTTLPKTLCFIAAGIGVAPFRSIIKSLLDGGELTAQIWLFHVVRNSGELVFKPDFAEWSGAKKHFHYVPSITNDKDADWKNEVERLADTLAHKRIDLKQTGFMLCGVPEFVKDMDAHLKAIPGIDPTQIRKEQW